MKLFVYGTLKQGYGNNSILRGAQFIGEAFTKKEYVLFDCGFPKAVPFTEDTGKFPLLPIIGEVYEIDNHHLQSCDRLEGHPSWYKRNTIIVWVPSLMQEEEVIIYEMNSWVNNKICLTTIYNNSIYYYWNR